VDLRIKPYWVWSDGKWTGRFRNHVNAEVEADRIASETGRSSAVIHVGLLRFRFVSAFPKDQEIDLHEYFDDYAAKLSAWSVLTMEWPPLP
jgi:hypothetical protein